MSLARPQKNHTDKPVLPSDPVKGGSTKWLMEAFQRALLQRSYPEQVTDIVVARENIYINSKLLTPNLQTANVAYELDITKTNSPLQEVVARLEQVIEALQHSKAATRSERDLEQAAAIRISEELAGYTNDIASLESEEEELAKLYENYVNLYREAIVLQAKISVPNIRDRKQNVVGISGDLEILYPTLKKSADAYMTAAKRYQTKRKDLYNTLSNLMERTGKKVDKSVAMQPAPRIGE